MSDYRRWLMDTAATTTAMFREIGRRDDGDRPNHTNRCIEWCRVQTLVLEHLGVKSRALPVNVMAGNRAAAPQLLYNLPHDGSNPEAWTVGVHHAQGIGNGGWDGHLVVLTPNPSGGRILIDGTADQLSRPQHQMTVPPIVFMNVPSLWLDSVFTNPELHEGIVRYDPMPPQAESARAWKTSGAWNTPVAVEMAEIIAAEITPFDN